MSQPSSQSVSTSAASELLRRCLETQRGDDWQRFVAEHGDSVRLKMYSAARRCGLGTRREDVDDMVQDLYCRILAARTPFRGGSDLELWAYIGRVAVSVAADRRRSAAALKRRRDRDWRALRFELQSRTPEERLMTRERRRIFLDRCRRAAHRRRRPLEARALRLAILEGWTSPEISRAVAGQLTPGQVDAAVHRLRRRLLREGLTLPPRRRVGPGKRRRAW